MNFLISSAGTSTGCGATGAGSGLPAIGQIGAPATLPAGGMAGFATDAFADATFLAEPPRPLVPSSPLEWAKPS